MKKDRTKPLQLVIWKYLCLIL